MKRFLPVLFAFISFISFAAPVDSGLSYELAGNFIASMPHIYKGNFTIIGTDSVSADDICILRIYHLSPKGFIIISADDSFYPVVAFSSDGNYTGEDMPGIKLFLDKWKKEATYLFEKQVGASPEISAMWEDLKNARYMFGNNKAIRSVTPLLTTQWNQSYPYNIACPPDAAGSGGYTYAGCVATAMGQLMFYHRWPNTGTGSYTYNHPVYGTISADFTATTYNWDAMPAAVTSENIEVAILLHHIGVSVDMDYGPNGSGMWNHHAALSFRTYFKYCPETRYIFRDSTTLNWDSLVVTNLIDKKPLYYAGWEDTTYTMGHAFVCDGYETNDYYHFNWGWSGTYDGYFYTGQMNPGGSNFNFCQELIVDIYPDTVNYTYPEYCQGLKEITTPCGTFTDGSGLNNYPSGSDCKWWINPACGIVPELSFDQFDLNPQDTLYIFEGTPSTHYLISFFTGDYPPLLNSSTTPTLLKTDSGSFYLEFHSDSTNNGFVASYNTTYCLAYDTLTESEGSIADGSEACNYKKSTNCRWLMQVPGTNFYHFTTDEFDLYSGSTTHTLKIYKESIILANLVYTFTSANPPPPSFSIEATKLHFRFFTTSTGSGQGWSFTYSTTQLSETTQDYNPGFYVYPNPADNTSIIFMNGFNEVSALTLFDVTGKNTGSYNIIPENSQPVSLQEAFPGIKPGFYLLQASGNSGIFFTRFIVN